MSSFQFSFRFGRVEWRARLPLADWIRPALWLMPVANIYGGFPASWEIDMMESSGNWYYYCGKQSRGEKQGKKSCNLKHYDYMLM